MINKIVLILNTVKYLKVKQLVYQIIYKIKPKRKLGYYFSPIEFKTSRLDFIEFTQPIQVSENLNFVFLNLEKKFAKEIDWNYSEYGKLWNYNLQYLNYLNQVDLTDEFKIEILLSINTKLINGELPLEPYPVSLRIINSIRFLNQLSNSHEKYNDILKSVYQQTDYLYHNLEYHILGNHLLENAFALLVSAQFFGNLKWGRVANNILVKELKIQILEDGAHFELSPMYHQIIYARVLEAIAFTSNIELKNVMLNYASKMLAWLKLITFENGSIPHFNDSTDGIAFSSNQLLSLSKTLNISEIDLLQFNDSGYRKYSDGKYELFVDVHGIAPSYQPGHAHSDHLSFVFNYLNEPILVDPSISTYNISKRRSWERSSEAHNTITINNTNQSQVWGGFRVAKRASATIISDSVNFISAEIKYEIGDERIIHRREISASEKIKITDTINSSKEAVARYYLHPNISSIEISNNEVILNKTLKFVFNNSKAIVQQNYSFAKEYNCLMDSKVIEVKFDKFLEVEIVTLS